MTFIIPAAAGGLVKTFLDARGSISATFNDVPFGAPDPNRYIIVGSCFGGSGAQPTACTIAGDGADLITGNGGARRARLWIAHVPTGTSGQVRLFGDGDGAGIVVWSLHPLFNANAFDFMATPGADLTTPDGGVAFGVAYTSSSGSVSISWNGLTQDGATNFDIGSNTGLISGASSIIPGNTDINVSVSHSPPGFATASFRPGE